MPYTTLGSIAIFAVVIIVDNILNCIIERKNLHGGWQELFRPFFSTLGIMNPVSRMDKHWIIPEGVNLPDNLICYFTLDLFVCPVVTPHGIVYERKEIQQWLLTHNTCPVTFLSLHSAQLAPCPTLLRLVDEFAIRYGLKLVE